MKKLHKSIKWLIIAFLSIALVVGIVWSTLLKFLPPDKERMEKCFQQDKDNLSIIVDYLSDLEYSFVSIDESYLEKGVMFTGAYTRLQKIDDETVLEALNSLLNSGRYETIGKNFNTVFFQKWSFIEKDRGIAVPINQNDKPLVEFLVHSEPLSEKGWYYYEADYEEYRNNYETIF